MTINVAVSRTIGGGSFTFNGASCQIIANGTNAYLEGDAHFWQQVGGTNPDVAALLAGKWVTGFSGSDLQALSQIANLKSLVASISTTAGKYTKTSVTKIDGISVIPITVSDGSQGYVTSTGQPYVVRMSKGLGEITFDQFNAATLPQVPKNAVNVNDLGS